MISIRRFILLLTLIPALAAQAESGSIHIVSDLWPGATEENGEGLYWDLVKQAFATQDISVEISHAPYARSVEEVIHGKADAWLGSYPTEVEQAVYSYHHLDIDVILAVSRNDQQIQSQADLYGKNLAWLRSFRFDRYMNVPVETREVNSQEHALKMLLAGQALTAFLTPASLFEPELEISAFSQEQLTATPILRLKLLIGFRNTERGIELRNAFDQGFNLLLQQGQVQRLYDKHGWGRYRHQ